MNDYLVHLVNAECSRRTLLRGTFGIAVALMPVSAALVAHTEALAADLPDDIAILNFALTLEHLEARAYRDALASGKLSGKNAAYAQAYGTQEAAHVALLMQAITQAGKTPVSAQATYNFPAFTDEQAVVGFPRHTTARHASSRTRASSLGRAASTRSRPATRRSSAARMGCRPSRARSRKSSRPTRHWRRPSRSSARKGTQPHGHVE
jgi:hypothetical protein